MDTLTLFLGLLSLYLTAARGERDTKTHLIISNQIYTAHNDWDLTCQDACDDSREILDCMLKSGGKCLSKYYLVCSRNHRGECQTINSSCPGESGFNGNKCEEAMRIKENLGQNTPHPSFRRLLRSSSPGMKPKLNILNRRDLSSADDVVPLYTQRSGMVSSTGNGHAFVLDGDKLMQSHFGSPPIISTFTGASSDSSMGIPMGLPFTFMSAVTQNFKDPNGRQKDQQQAKDRAAYNYAQYPPYRPHTNPFYTSDYSPYYGGGYGPDMGGYARPAPYSSPFSSFFNSLGLQDPTLMLQYLPIGSRRHFPNLVMEMIEEGISKIISHILHRLFI